MVLNMGPLDCESSTLTTKPLKHFLFKYEAYSLLISLKARTSAKGIRSSVHLLEEVMIYPIWIGHQTRTFICFISNNFNASLSKHKDLTLFFKCFRTGLRLVAYLVTSWTDIVFEVARHLVES